MPERQNSSSQLLTPLPADGDPLSFSPGSALTRRISGSALDVTPPSIDTARRRPSVSPVRTSPAAASPAASTPASAAVSTRTSPTKTHAVLTPRPKRPSLDPDLLGIGSSGGRKFSSRRVSSHSRTRAALGLEGIDSEDVLDTRYDEMSDQELQAALDRWTIKPLSLGSKSDSASSINGSPASDDDSHKEHDEQETPRSDKRRPPVRTASPRNPVFGEQSTDTTSSPLAPKLTRTSSSNQPLFPPSPPQAPKSSEHPLRVLSKAVRELMASVSRLEAENEMLRDTVAEQAAQISKLAQAASPAQAMASRPRSICKESTDRGSSEAVSIPKSDQVSCAAP